MILLQNHLSLHRSKHMQKKSWSITWENFMLQVDHSFQQCLVNSNLTIPCMEDLVFLKWECHKFLISNNKFWIHLNNFLNILLKLANLNSNYTNKSLKHLQFSIFRLKKWKHQAFLKWLNNNFHHSRLTFLVMDSQSMLRKTLLIPLEHFKILLLSHNKLFRLLNLQNLKTHFLHLVFLHLKHKRLSLNQLFIIQNLKSSNKHSAFLKLMFSRILKAQILLRHHNFKVLPKNKVCLHQYLIKVKLQPRSNNWFKQWWTFCQQTLLKSLWCLMGNNKSKWWCNKSKL